MNAELSCSERDSRTRLIAIDCYNARAMCASLCLINLQANFLCRMRGTSAPCVF